MLERLKVWHYRRRHGPERANLILRMEREMRALPPQQLSTEWIEWFWLQPPEVWEEAMAMRQRGESHSNEPPQGETARRPPMTPEEAAAYKARIEAQTSSILSQVDLGRKLLDVSFDRAHTAFEKAAARIETQTGRLPSPWQAWVESLPEGTRAEGAQACRLWLEMLDLREALREAIAERKTLSGIHLEEARRVMDVRMFSLRSRLRRCDETYRESAGPFFEQHGRPPVEGFQRPKTRPQKVAVPNDFERRLELGLVPVTDLTTDSTSPPSDPSQRPSDEA